MQSMLIRRILAATIAGGLCIPYVGAYGSAGTSVNDVNAAIEPLAVPDVVISSWARAEVERAYESGFIRPNFSLGSDFSAPITRKQFAQLAVGLLAAFRQMDEIQLAQESGITIEGLIPVESGSEEPQLPEDPASSDTPDRSATPDTPNPSEQSEPSDISNPSEATENPESAIPEAPMKASTEPLSQEPMIEEPMPEVPAVTTVYLLPDTLTVVESRFADTNDLYIALAAHWGGIQGRDDGLFHPEEQITRQEAAQMLQKGMLAMGQADANLQPQVYSDVYEIARWAIEAVKFVSGRTTPFGQPIMGGSEGKFRPNDSLTIEQAILALNRCKDSLRATAHYPAWKTAPGYDTVSLVMTFGGDCTFGRGIDFPYEGSFDQMYDTLRDPAYFFSGIAEFHSDDITMVNFEGTLTTATRPAQKTFVFKGPAEYAEILPVSSIDVVTVANNHSMDYLQQGFNDTIANLSPYVAISGYDRMPILNVKGIHVAFISQTGWSFGTSEKDFIRNAVQKVRNEGADIVICNYHWGKERSYHSNSTQQALAHYAIDCGADLVIGHHPHVVQEVETYHGKQIAYSLGNLVFGGNRNPSEKNCLIFQQTFTVNLDTHTIVDTSYRALPYRVSSVNYRNDYHPVPAF